jgi:transcriptional regulator with XRE-family HTH domain
MDSASLKLKTRPVFLRLQPLCPQCAASSTAQNTPLYNSLQGVLGERFPVDERSSLCQHFGYMLIGKRLRDLREQASLSQGDIERRTGLLRCYISRVENGHTVPSLETLERMAAALEVPLYELFYEGDGSNEPGSRGNAKELAKEAEAEGEARFLEKVKRLTERIDEKDHQLLLYVAQKLVSR